jgi:hypothetical protein
MRHLVCSLLLVFNLLSAEEGDSANSLVDYLKSPLLTSASETIKNLDLYISTMQMNQKMVQISPPFQIVSAQEARWVVSGLR